MNERKLIISSSESSMAEVIKTELASSRACIIISAFLGTGFHNMLVRQIEQAVEDCQEVKILTSTMQNFNRPEVLQSFQKMATELRIYRDDSDGEAFHVKSYIFLSRLGDDESVIILGSSNFTQMGLRRNREWNILLRGDREVLGRALEEFQQYWDHQSFVPDEDFFQTYKSVHIAARQQGIQSRTENTSPGWTEGVGEAAQTLTMSQVKPNIFQKEALNNLRDLREQQIERALVVAATGTGKTFLAAMDFIGNYRTSFIPYLTLRGITAARAIKPGDIPKVVVLPEGCFVDENLESPQPHPEDAPALPVQQ